MKRIGNWHAQIGAPSSAGPVAHGEIRKPITGGLIRLLVPEHLDRGEWPAGGHVSVSIETARGMLCNSAWRDINAAAVKLEGEP